MKFTEFVKNNKIMCILFPIVASLVYAPLVFINGYFPDAEHVSVNGTPFYNWENLGRFGLIALKTITGLKNYNRIAEAIAFCVAFAALIFFFSYFVCYINKKIPAGFAFLSAYLFLIFPTYTDQYVFQFQSFEVTFALLLTVVSAFLMVLFVRKKAVWAFILSIFLSAFSFGVYQSMLSASLALIYMVSVLLYDVESDTLSASGTSNENKNTQKAEYIFINKLFRSFISPFGYMILGSIQLCLSAGVYKIIEKLTCKTGTYITNQIAWKTSGFAYCFNNLKQYIKTVLFGLKYMYTNVFLFASALALFALVFAFIKNGKKALSIIIPLIGLYASPFFMAIVMGSEPAPRTQCALPLCTAALMLFTYSVFSSSFAKSNEHDIRKDKNRRMQIVLLLLIASIMIFLNLYKTERLIYSYRVIAQSDRENALRIANDLKQYNCNADDEDSKPVVFIGTIRGMTNDITYEYNPDNREYVLTSVFILDEGIDPQYYYSSKRILGYMKMLGYNYKNPEPGDMAEAYAKGENMVQYPGAELKGQDYIKETDNIIIVRLTNYSPY